MHKYPSITIISYPLLPPLFLYCVILSFATELPTEEATLLAMPTISVTQLIKYHLAKIDK
jgi:hypothetical protein